VLTYMLLDVVMKEYVQSERVTRTSQWFLLIDDMDVQNL